MSDSYLRLKEIINKILWQIRRTQPLARGCHHRDGQRPSPHGVFIRPTVEKGRGKIAGFCFEQRRHSCNARGTQDELKSLAPASIVVVVLKHGDGLVLGFAENVISKHVHLWSVRVDRTTLVEELVDDGRVVDNDQVACSRLERHEVTILLGPGLELQIRLLHWNLQQISEPRSDRRSRWLEVVGSPACQQHEPASF